MAGKEKLIIFIVFIIAIAAIILSYFYIWPEETTQILGPSRKLKEGITPPPATGNIDNAADAIIKELDDIEITLSEEKGDTAFITGDSREISDFGQSYNENEL